MRYRPRRGERGASAVEFALVAPLLFGLLFGVIDYGLYFADVLTVQQGLSDRARAATVVPAGTTSPWGARTCSVTVEPLDPTASDQLEAVVCGVVAQVTPLGGRLSVRARLVDATGLPTTTWAAGSRLRLCSTSEHPAVLPMVPLPGGGRFHTRVDMPVQGSFAGAALTTYNPVTYDATGDADWSWC